MRFKRNIQTRLSSRLTMRGVLAIFLSALLFMPLMASAQYSQIEPISSYVPTQETIKLPEVVVTNISTAEEYPEEQKPIQTTVTVLNNDTIFYPALFQLYATLTILTFNPHEREEAVPIIIANQSLPALSPKQSVEISFNFTAEIGTYTLTAYVAFNNTMLVNSKYSIVLQVISKPVGDVPTLLEAIALIFVAAVGMLVTPAIVDAIRLRNYQKRNGTTTSSSKPATEAKT